MDTFIKLLRPQVTLSEEIGNNYTVKDVDFIFIKRITKKESRQRPNTLVQPLNRRFGYENRRKLKSQRMERWCHNGN
jgi:hypothetical protein